MNWLIEKLRKYWLILLGGTIGFVIGYFLDNNHIIFDTLAGFVLAFATWVIITDSKLSRSIN